MTNTRAVEPMGAEVGRPAERGFLGALALLFAASAAATVAWCVSMSSVRGMPMPGNWTMSMAWMRMPGQGWPGAAASFLGMWTLMMIAMMLPTLVPLLRRYRAAVSPRAPDRLGALTVRVGAGYFGAWILSGAAVYPPGVVLAEMAMRVPQLARAVPVLAATVVAIAGVSQLTAWKSRQLACCRRAFVSAALAADARTAWAHGWTLGIRCIRCCAGLTAVLLVLGVMDLTAMAVVTVAIALERLTPAGERVARITGAILIVASAMMLGSAAAA
jgi:predicted metal-binding membrane protein